MDCKEPASKKAKKAEAGCAIPRKTRILLAACGTVDAVKFGHVCGCFAEWAEVRAVVTKSCFYSIGEQTFPRGVLVYWDEHEWPIWKRINRVLHIELRRWADVLVIAPLSENTLAKIERGLCDNLLTCIVRAWDYRKPLFVAPSMNISMGRRNPSREQHCIGIDELGIILIPPSGESEHGAMADPSTIYSTVRLYYEQKMRERNNRGQV